MWYYKELMKNTTINTTFLSLQWCNNEHDGVSNHPRDNCSGADQRKYKKILKFRVTGLCARKSPCGRWIPVQRISNAENVSIWWRHHASPRARDGIRTITRTTRMPAFWDTPRCPMITHTRDSHQIPSQSKYRLKRKDKNKSREEIFYQMKVFFFLLRSVVGSVFF